MIDINIIKANGKYYSVKCDLIFSNDKNESVNVKVIGLDLVDPSGATSFTKIKSLFHSTSYSDTLSKIKYPYIYDAIIKKIIQKYKIKVINI